ncbi:hypothetical protein EXIGLDRAFT_703409 [Exidia glandulosa HHB12029]|uniref:Fungal calcium binding protein domain-containing protein n=1 Tax=Exidia glandulosa HHB12029 TaxID=1314781 RepID=A0A165C391_EXIGL|nr:hypothetical protein EXIGLDRAFT_703409 [Exidia glandulosa HHB12029]
MQFSFVAILALAASVSASAIGNVRTKRAGECDVAACLTSMESVLSSCIPAIVGGFSDIGADIKCFTGAISVFKEPFMDERLTPTQTEECTVCIEEIKGVFEGIGQKKL